MSKKYGLKTYNQPLTTLSKLAEVASGDLDNYNSIYEGRLLSINKFLTSTIDESQKRLKLSKD